ncbi:SDR family oxidoreductase [Legionella geestiana]|uniref:SDR family NAD(P)-dependent oxidoreductase n=1 Tax=Legionella geestiana TaxID=45065 RepID=UPI001092E297|nr:SDR family oxidoreductase [Legionella geestiana]QDQ39996.1 SDR family oxidoreductase [Legionella geestiana]
METNQAFSLAGQNILVTGASSGIGRACAIACANMGARVILSGRNADALDATRAMMISPELHYVAPLDLASLELIQPTMLELVQATGPLNGIAHCAGMHITRPLRILSAQNISDVVNINVTSGIMLAKAFRHKQVSTRPASIVFLSSITGLVGQPAIVPYAISKGALLAATKSLAIELAPEKIRVNSVLPGVVHTPMSDEWFEKLNTEQIDVIKSAHPLGLGKPEDVANAVVYLLSPAASWITGTNLIIDGGYTAI